MGEKSNRDVWPPPPFYHKRFTDEAKEEFDSLKDGDIPDRLKHFEPPEIPEEFMRFGQIQSAKIIRQELPSELPRLYDEEKPIKHELLRLHRECIIETKDVVDKMINNPNVVDQITKIKQRMLNIAFLINELRPSEAHEKLVAQLQKTENYLTEKATSTKAVRQKVEEVLRAAKIKFED